MCYWNIHMYLCHYGLFITKSAYVNRVKSLIYYPLPYWIIKLLISHCIGCGGELFPRLVESATKGSLFRCKSSNGLTRTWYETMDARDKCHISFSQKNSIILPIPLVSLIMNVVALPSNKWHFLFLLSPFPSFMGWELLWKK